MLCAMLVSTRSNESGRTPWAWPGALHSRRPRAHWLGKRGDARLSDSDNRNGSKAQPRWTLALHGTTAHSVTQSGAESPATASMCTTNICMERRATSSSGYQRPAGGVWKPPRIDHLDVGAASCTLVSGLRDCCAGVAVGADFVCEGFDGPESDWLPPSLGICSVLDSTGLIFWLAR
jgi:hypothetical protein